ncbi:MAG TPA: cation-transporting P-type ATPase, partial [Quisquiliibacterium sp.]|nr:cation-transporting P-type ATPase [Quisquiliibacterium sp.]
MTERQRAPGRIDAAPGVLPRGDWHAAEADAVLAAFDSTPHGLSGDEAARRLALHGPNRLAEARPAGLLVRLARQFNNLLLYVLMAAAAVTGLMGHWVDA